MPYKSMIETMKHNEMAVSMINDLESHSINLHNQ